MTDKEQQVARIIYGANYWYVSWDQADPFMHQRCEDAAAQIVALLKPVAVDRGRLRNDILTAFVSARVAWDKTRHRIGREPNYDLGGFSQHIADAMMALIDAIAPVKLPTRSRLRDVLDWDVTIDGNINLLIAAGLATEDDESPVGSDFDPDKHEWIYESGSSPMGYKIKQPLAPQPADASESERDELAYEICKKTGRHGPLENVDSLVQFLYRPIADAILAAGYRRQPSVPTRSQLYELQWPLGFGTSRVMTNGCADSLIAAGYAREDPDLPIVEPDPIDANNEIDLVATDIDQSISALYERFNERLNDIEAMIDWRRKEPL